MPTITIKNMPERLYEALKNKAQQHHRSLNKEVIHSLEYAVQDEKMTAQEILTGAREVREKIAKYRVSEKRLNKMKRQGRA